jgi:uncharacterized protein
VKPFPHDRQEPEFAGDRLPDGFDQAARGPVLALDRGSVRTLDADGRLHVEITNISKANVCPYQGHEIPDFKNLGLDPGRIYQLYRDPQELAQAVPTFNGVQVLRRHVPVSAADHRPYDTVGATGTDAVFEAPYLRNSLVIWSRDDIAEIEADSKKELSCAYRYRADMTPGRTPDGEAYDGVMRDIVANHVALVEDGRAGPDVVVGDSKENLMTAKTVKLAPGTMARLFVRTMLTGYVRPKLAQDARIDWKTVLGDLTKANFKERKPSIAAAFTAQLKDVKLAKDAELSDVVGLLDALEAHVPEESKDESVSEPQHKAMEAAAHGNSTLGIPETVGKEFVSKDAEPLKAYLKEKGMADDDIEHAIGLMPGGKAADAEPAPKQPDVDANDPAKNGAKDMVTQKAMDAAITSATEKTAAAVEKRLTEKYQGIREAEAEVQPWVGKLAIAHDSAEAIYRATLVALGEDQAIVKDLPLAAMRVILKRIPKPGERQAQVQDQNSRQPAMDAAQTKTFNERFPGVGQIRVMG